MKNQTALSNSLPFVSQVWSLLYFGINIDGKIKFNAMYSWEGAASWLSPGFDKDRSLAWLSCVSYCSDCGVLGLINLAWYVPLNIQIRTIFNRRWPNGQNWLYDQVRCSDTSLTSRAGCHSLNLEPIDTCHLGTGMRSQCFLAGSNWAIYYSFSKSDEAQQSVFSVTSRSLSVTRKSIKSPFNLTSLRPQPTPDTSTSATFRYQFYESLVLPSSMLGQLGVYFFRYGCSLITTPL
jgi:hypothetical protein